MDENRMNRDEAMGVDFQRLVRALLNKSWMIMLTSVLCVVLVLLGTFFLVTPQYEATAMFYVNNSSFSVGDASLSISSGDLSTSRNLVDSYIVILNTRETLNDVIDYAGANRSYSELKEMIQAGAVSETEIFRVTVTSPDPNEAEKLANAIAYILPKRIGTIIDGTSAKVVDAAVVPMRPSSPNYTTNAIVGFLLGFVMSVGVIALREIFDITIRTEEDVAQSCGHPILASVPDMTAPTKGGSYYGYGSDRGGKKRAGAHTGGKSQSGQPVLLGDGISFTASEAYKLLRTKIQFSFADEDGCRVIGLSSALSGEGKSLTATNLAYSLAQLNKKVILVDCDMRRPTLAEKLHVRKKPGLSSYLTGQCALVDVVQRCEQGADGNPFNVIAAGQNPPNPVELLSSTRMERMLEALRKVYDYVIIDLPPVGEVSDAMAVAKKTDGMLLVVRQNCCDRIVLSEAARQFAFMDTRILGIVFNGTAEHTGKYGKHYYKRYGKNFASGYERNDRSVSGGDRTAQ